MLIKKAANSQESWYPPRTEAPWEQRKEPCVFAYTQNATVDRSASFAWGLGLVGL